MPTFSGVYTAVPTPFTADGSAVDYAAFERLIEQQIASGVTGIVLVGTTGESPTITYEEHAEVMRRGIEMVGKRIQVIAGTGANSTAEAIMFSREAESFGADGLLIVAPYYNKPTQEGLKAHFLAIADSVHTPIILYNIPSRTGVNITTDVVIELAKHPNIVGVKEASGNVNQMMDVLERAPADFAVLSGDDDLTLPLIAAGGHGVISVISNYVPRTTVKMVRAALAGDFATARQLHYQLRPVIRSSFIETNPVPCKELLALLGACSASVRLPLVPVSDRSRATLAETAALIRTLEPESWIA